MSSILRALRKLEEDSHRGQDSPAIKTKRSEPGKTGISRDTYRLLSIILTVMLIAAAAWIISNSSKQPSPVKTMESSPGKPAAAVSPQQSPSLETEATRDARLPSESSDQPRLDPATAVPGIERTAQPGTEAAEAGKPATQEESTEQAEHPGFVLNGVLWSDSPGRRVALINDQYLKEGDVINGAKVIKIERRAVTLQTGEKIWVIRVKK